MHQGSPDSNALLTGSSLVFAIVPGPSPPRDFDGAAENGWP
jgi:hypothetical protein